jgi:hypothetical protein
MQPRHTDFHRLTPPDSSAFPKGFCLGVLTSIGFFAFMLGVLS